MHRFEDAIRVLGTELNEWDTQFAIHRERYGRSEYDQYRTSWNGTYFVSANWAEMAIVNRSAIREPSALLAEIAPHSAAAVRVGDRGESPNDIAIPAALLGLSRIRLAAAASVVSKVSSVALQLVAVPV